MGSQIPVCTYSDWSQPLPGFLEIDLVAHCGGTLSGSFIHSLLAREQSLVVEGLEAIARQLPFPVLGIDSDNDSVFINQTLVEYCADRRIEFARSRGYRKNDQAWIEQKNGSVVRRFAGHDRYSGQIAGQSMVHLYKAVRLHVNYFQPSFKLLEKIRDGARVIKRYSPPATPCDRVMQHDEISGKSCVNTVPDWIRWCCCVPSGRHSLRWQRCPHLSSRKLLTVKALTGFWPACPACWQQGEVLPTHTARVRPPRQWRTRKDPFEGVWCEVLLWLQQDPDTNAKDLLAKLRGDHPGRFGDVQLRTLQRRVKDWHGVMAKRLVYAASVEPAPERSEKVELVLVGAGNKG